MACGWSCLARFQSNSHSSDISGPQKINLARLSTKMRSGNDTFSPLSYSLYSATKLKFKTFTCVWSEKRESHCPWFFFKHIIQCHFQTTLYSILVINLFSFLTSSHSNLNKEPVCCLSSVKSPFPSRKKVHIYIYIFWNPSKHTSTWSLIDYISLITA